MTQKEILWYAVRGARSFLLDITETMEKPLEPVVEKVYLEMYNKTMKDIDKLIRRLNDIRGKELEEKEVQQ